ncbi:MAG: RNA 3'-terminal phosphate cyclase [ANME-2 cluster archaeon]|nr:RNA 3'-terminal phosphate cyclase [ANME-2 cluster archaeon]MBC2701672.1 RNA 3'-terminal phosphate cyclase [ANME-2 cluster archaeon]
MINIDGSYGEGGGQIIRTAVALSAVTGTDVTISNIRSNRPKSGLKAQHMSAIRTAADMTGARISGLKSGSTELTFSPGVSTSGGIPGGYYKIDIGTAGSITLLLQCLMPIALAAQEPVSLDITGGTDVAWSPPIDYMAHVLLPVLETMGLKCNIKLQRRGYYPRGGGRVAAIIHPSALRAVDLDKEKEADTKKEEGMEKEWERGKEKEPCRVAGISHSSNLPPHVMQRQADAATAALEKAGYSSSIDTWAANSPSTGSGITLWCGHAGGSALGKRGLPAEKVGKAAAGEIITELGSGAAVDVHLADQLIPYIGLAGGGSLTVRDVSGHTRTNIWVVEQFLGVEFRIEEKKDVFKISL